jgi:hypothetical protein
MVLSGVLRRSLPIIGFCAVLSCTDVRVLAVEIAVIALEPTTASILPGDSVQFVAKLMDGSGNVLGGHDVAWSSSDPGTASIDARGLVRGVAPGHADITAASEGWSARAEVAVNRPMPALASIQPSSAQRLQTVDLTLAGSRFDEAAVVDLGPGITMDEVRVTAPDTIRVKVTIQGDAPLGSRGISVTNPPPGGGTAELPGAFTVLAEHPSPALTQVSPAEGQRRETLAVALSGTGFVQGLTTVDFGPGITLDSVRITGSGSIGAIITIASSATLGARDVSVTNPAPGGGTARLVDAFTVRPENPSPTVSDVSPETGQRRDRLDVTLTGSGFVQGLTTASFGPDITVNEVRVTGPTSLTVDISIDAGATLGTRDLSVTNPAPGGGTATLRAGFTVLEENPPPALTAVLPAVGQAGATLDVTLVGSGFVQGLTSVSFGPGVSVNSVNVVFWTSLTANITIAGDAQPGSRDVSVTNSPPGGGTFILHDAFSVRPPGGS